MYSIVEIKGKQYKIEPKAVINVDYLGSEMEGKSLSSNEIKVLLHKDDNNSVKVGTPYLENISVKAKVVKNIRGNKIKVVHYKPNGNQGHAKTRGHHQRFSRIEIDSISGT